jgi:hypothetical protein
VAGTHAKGVLAQGAEEDMWNEEGGGKKGMKDIA